MVSIEDKDSEADNTSLLEIEDVRINSKSQTGVEDSNSHTSLCNDLKVLKMKGLIGRPRKKNRNFRNPFDFGCNLKKNLRKKSQIRSRRYANHLASINEEEEDMPWEWK